MAERIDEEPETGESFSDSKRVSTPEEPAVEALIDVYAALAEKLYSPIILERLLEDRILTKVEYDTAKSKGTDYEKNTEILSALRRDGTGILRFCQLLFEQNCNQHNLGRILLAALKHRNVDVSSIKTPSPNPPVIKNSSPRYYLEIADLDDTFITLVRRVKAVGEDVKDLRTICVQLLSKVTSSQRNVQEDIDKLRDCSSGDCIMYLQPYWDSLDCDLLFRLIRQLENPELMTRWQKYKTQVKEACRAILTECKKSLPPQRELPGNQISVGFQMDQPPHDVTVQKILDLKDFLVKMIGLEEADFEGFANSEVTLFYTVSRIRLPFLVRLFALHRRSLRGFSITVVFVPGQFIYDVITDQEFPYPMITSHSERQFLQVKDLKEEMLHQFEELKKSEITPLGETQIIEMNNLKEEMFRQFEELKDSKGEVMSSKLKLKEAEMERLRAEKEKQKIAGDFVELQKEKKKLEDQLTQKDETFLGRVKSIQEVLACDNDMFSTQIVPILKQNAPPYMQEEVSGPQAKILARLDLYLSQKREEDKKSGDSESLAALKSQLHEISSELNEKMEKHKALTEDFIVQFQELGEKFTTKLGEQVQKQLHEMEEPFQIEIPMQSSSMVIGTRGQNLRRIERKTGVKKMTVVPTSKKGTAHVTLFGDPSACERAKIEVRILLASHVNMSKKDIIFLTRFSGKQILSFRSSRAHEDVLLTKHYRLEAVGEKVMSEELRSMEVLSRQFSEVITEMLKSTSVPQVVIEARFGRLFWKTNHALTRDDLERKYPLERLEKDGLVRVEDILGSSHWTFQTVYKTQESKEEIAKLMSPENLGLVSIGEIETIRISFVHIPDEPDKDYVLYGLNARMCENGKFELVRITPRMKKEILFDCLPLEGNLDIRMALSAGPVCSEEEGIKMTKLASEMAEGLSVKDGSLYLHKSYQECRIFHVRRSKKKLYLMHHEDHQYILLDSNVEDCVVSRQNLDDDATQYPLKDHHREIELWNCQWLADFALLEGKDWKDFFISSGCDVSQISVIPKPVKPETIVEELGPFIRCALRITQS